MVDIPKKNRTFATSYRERMKRRILLLIIVFAAWTLIFAVEKPLFMAFYHAQLPVDAPLFSCWQVIVHGLTLDLSMAGYLSIVPALLIIASVFTHHKILRYLANAYLLIAALVVATTFLLNLVLYGYWGFPLDSTPLFYFFSSPKDALASVSMVFAIGGTILAVLIALLLWAVMRRVLLPLPQPMRCVKGKIQATFILLLATALLFLPIRGGVTVSSNNTGKVYFSDIPFLNHAAVNPAFSLMESISHRQDFAQQYRFMEPEKANQLFSDLVYTQSDSTVNLLKERRPNVLVVILESFSSKLMASLGGEANVTPCLDSIAHEGILFTRFYANSFRTDRGLVSILSGYPAQPTMSLMKFPKKTDQLPSIARSMAREGYETAYYYGGDADFCNMRSYLKAAGYSKIVADIDFPLNTRISKWGVPDHLLFRRFVSDVSTAKTNKPTFCVVQTSSSHEPFEVPYQRLSDPVLNAFAYTDHHLGWMMHQLQQTALWQHLLVVIVPDHLGAFPHDISNYTLARYQIPLILTGGAITGAKRIDTIGSQHDIAATLLGQLGINHEAFTFSKDMLCPHAPHFAFFTCSDLFGMVTDESQIIFDNKQQKTVVERGTNSAATLERGKAYLQKLYDDIAKR